MPLSKGEKDRKAAHRAEIVNLWGEGLTAREIADRLAVSLATALNDIHLLQAKGLIAKRNAPRPQAHRVQKTVGRPSKGASTPIDRARQKAAYDHEKEAWAKAKRVVTIAQARGELRVIKFFGDCAEAASAPRGAITGVCPGVVTGDAVFMASGGGKSNVWALWQVLEGVAA